VDKDFICLSSSGTIFFHDIKNHMNLMAQLLELVGIKGLGSIAQSLFGFVVNFHHQSVGLYSNGGTAQGHDLISPSRGMTGIDNNRKMTFFPDHGYGGKI
jgi:hypothetical protein